MKTAYNGENKLLLAYKVLAFLYKTLLNLYK